MKSDFQVQSSFPPIILMLVQVILQTIPPSLYRSPKPMSWAQGVCYPPADSHSNHHHTNNCSNTALILRNSTLKSRR